MTGASSFTQLYAPPRGRWEYSATESPDLVTPRQIWEAGFDYVVTDELDAYRDTVSSKDGERWACVRTVEAFAGICRRKGWPPVRIRRREEVGIFARAKDCGKLSA